MIAFLLSHSARNGENCTGDFESPTVSVLRVRDMASCRDFVSFYPKFQGISQWKAIAKVIRSIKHLALDT